MPSRSVFPIIMFAALSWGVPALAQGNSDGNANANASANGSSQASDKGQENGNGNGNGNGENSNSQGNGKPPASTSPETAEPTAPAVADPGIAVEPGAAELSESDILDAVGAGRAVPLASILPNIRARTGGQVINAKLEQVGDLLLYALTVLTADGTVTTEFYDARSGQLVER